MTTGQSARRALAASSLLGGLVVASLAAISPAEAAGQITVSFRDGVLRVVGNDSANVVQLVRTSNGGIQVRADSRIVRRGGTPTVRNVRAIRIATLGGADRVRVGAGLRGALINGGDGNDTLSGGNGADVVRGAAGNDSVYGGNGNDVVVGDAGDDYVSGQAGHDRVQGRDGRDTVVGQAGNDILRGQAGDDEYAFDPGIAQGSDVVVEAAGAGSDGFRFFGPTAVTFTLASAATQVISPSLSIRLTAVDTFENVLGSSGNDTLTGNAVANRLNGGQGDDQLTGGAGADAIVPGEGFGEDFDGVVVAAWFGHDTVTDFDATDTVDLYADQAVGTSLPAATVSITGARDEGMLTATGYSFVEDDFS